jgi:hypothetical protein
MDCLHYDPYNAEKQQFEIGTTLVTEWPTQTVRALLVEHFSKEQLRRFVIQSLPFLNVSYRY